MTDLNPVKALKGFQQKQWGAHWAVTRSSVLALSIPKKLGNSSELMSPLQARWEGGKPSVWRIRGSCSICPTREYVLFVSVFSEPPSALLLCHIPPLKCGFQAPLPRWVVPFALPKAGTAPQVPAELCSLQQTCLGVYGIFWHLSSNEKPVIPPRGNHHVLLLKSSPNISFLNRNTLVELGPQQRQLPRSSISFQLSKCCPLSQGAEGQKSGYANSGSGS